MKKIFRWFNNLFKKTKALANRFLAPSIATVEALKNVVESPLIPVITSLIPGNLDNSIILALKRNLPKVLQVLRISEECIDLSTPDEIIICCIKKLREYNQDGKDAAYHSIAALLAHYASDRRLSWTECITLAELMYQKNKNNENF